MGTTGKGLGDRNEWMRGRWSSEQNPHRIDAAEEWAARVRVDRDPLFVWFASLAVVRRDDVGLAVVRGDPLIRGRCTLRAHGGRDQLGSDRWIRLAVLVDLEAVGVALIEELVRQDERVKVAVRIESPDRVGVVRPSFISGYVALNGPGRPAVC